MRRATSSLRASQASAPMLARREDEPVGIAQAAAREGLGELREDGDAGAVVVCQRRVAHVRGEQELPPGPSRDDVLAVAHVADAVFGRDPDLVGGVGQPLDVTVAHAEPPVVGEVRRAVGDPVRLVGQAVDVLAKLAQRQAAVHRDAVVHHVEVAVCGVEDHPAVGVPDPRLAEPPFARHGPVENPGVARHLGADQPDLPVQNVQRLPDPRPGHAAADRVEFGGEGVDRVAEGAVRAALGAPRRLRFLPRCRRRRARAGSGEASARLASQFAPSRAGACFPVLMRQCRGPSAPRGYLFSLRRLSPSATSSPPFAPGRGVRVRGLPVLPRAC